MPVVEVFGFVLVADPGAVDQHIDKADPVGQALEQKLQAGEIGDVRLMGFDTSGKFALGDPPCKVARSRSSKIKRCSAWAAKLSATARPIPLAAPVITIVRNWLMAFSIRR